MFDYLKFLGNSSQSIYARAILRLGPSWEGGGGREWGVDPVCVGGDGGLGLVGRL